MKRPLLYSSCFQHSSVSCLLHTPAFWHRPLHTPTYRLLTICSPGDPDEEQRTNGNRCNPLPLTFWTIHN
jgi:hypothetical protein